MQRRFDPFPDTVDLNQGSNSNGMDESDDWSVLSPMERRLLNNDLSNELNFGLVNVNTNNGWDVGESSSRGNSEPNWLASGTRDLGLAGPSNWRSSESNRAPMNVNLNIGYEDSNSDDEDETGFLDFYKSSETEAGGSCKRKTLEGTSPHVYNGSGSLNISSGSVNPVPMNHYEQPGTRIGLGTSVPLVSLVQDSSPTLFGPRGSGPYDNLSMSGNPNRHAHQSNRQILLNEFLDPANRGPTNNSSNPQPLLMPVPTLPRNTPPFLWGNNIGSSSNSSAPRLERGSEPNFRSVLRNNMRFRSFVPPSETRNIAQDPNNWSLASGNATGSGGPRGSNAAWASPSQQRPIELPPWTLFPSHDPESGTHRSPFSPFPGGSSTSSVDNHISSGPSTQRNQHQPFPRSGLLMEVPAGDAWRVLDAGIDGRQRLVSEIRQVLHAMRRGENLRSEDYMLFDPFINGVAELHDRHRDMRLDVDNMSYEELLALEERIGDVKTGLSEEVILKSMKRRLHMAPIQVLEPCCICQEEYETGDAIGTLDCGHDFHPDCIVQWLKEKNVCPICKMTGIAP